MSDSRRLDPSSEPAERNGPDLVRVVGGATRRERHSGNGKGRRAVGMAAASAVSTVAAVAALGLTPITPAGADSSGAGSGGGSVSVGASAGSGSGGSSGTSSGGGGSAGASPWECTYTYLALNNEGGFPNGGPTPGAWYSVTCVDTESGTQVTQTVWITSSQPTATPPVNPYALAVQAENSIALPDPSIHLDPWATSVVNLATWLWVDPAIWHGESVTASAGTVTATAVARPVAVVWSTGDGGSVTCAGPGIAYEPSEPATWQTTDCSHVYTDSSAGQPSPDGNPDDGAFTVTATVVWSVSWTSTGVAGGGALPTLYTTSSVPLRVVQVESVNTSEADSSVPASVSIEAGP